MTTAVTTTPLQRLVVAPGDGGKLDAEGRDPRGFVICFACSERLGSPWCCDRRAEVVLAYKMQALAVFAR